MLGRRISRTVGGTTTRPFSSVRQIRLEAVGGTTTATYTYGNGLVRKDSEYFQYDGLGSARTITNGSQTVTGTAIYEGFEATIATTGSSSSPYLFAATSGYRNDNDEGLMHVGARYYDPQVGRFITRDTELDQHPFLYCDHDPVNKVDPTGHDGEEEGIWGTIKRNWKKIWSGWFAHKEKPLPKPVKPPVVVDKQIPKPESELLKKIRPPGNGPGGGTLEGPFPGFIIMPKGFWDGSFIIQLLYSDNPGTRA